MKRLGKRTLKVLQRKWLQLKVTNNFKIEENVKFYLSRKTIFTYFMTSLLCPQVVTVNNRLLDWDDLGRDMKKTKNISETKHNKTSLRQEGVARALTLVCLFLLVYDFEKSNCSLTWSLIFVKRKVKCKATTSNFKPLM